MQANQSGTLLESKTGSFTDKESGEQIHFGRIQVMYKDDDDQGFYKIRNIKCKKENFGLLDDAQKLKGKKVDVVCDVQEFGKQSHFFAKEVRPL